MCLLWFEQLNLIIIVKFIREYSHNSQCEQEKKIQRSKELLFQEKAFHLILREKAVTFLS